MFNFHKTFGNNNEIHAIIPYYGIIVCTFYTIVEKTSLILFSIRDGGRDWEGKEREVSLSVSIVQIRKMKSKDK